MRAAVIIAPGQSHTQRGLAAATRAESLDYAALIRPTHLAAQSRKRVLAGHNSCTRVCEIMRVGGATVTLLTEPLNMHLVIECLRCERACRNLAAQLTNPNDKRALELMAAGWARRAAERLRKLDSEATAARAPLGARSEAAAA